MISVIIPVYNVEKYLSECLHSICNQTFEDLEIICVNDGSTDNSLNILQNYAKKDLRIKIITQENKGLGCARNVGLAHATGEYIVFIDSDDFLFENSIEKMYINARSNNSDLVIFRFNIFDEGNFSRGGFGLENMFGDKDYLNFTFNYKDLGKFLLNANFAAWSKFYRRDFLTKHDFTFPVGTAYEDVLFHVETLIKADSLSFVPEFLYNYRESNSDSIMHNNDNIWDILAVCDSVESFLKTDGYFDELKLKFLIFKITQLVQYVLFSQSEEFFDVVCEIFQSFDETYNISEVFSELPDITKNIFHQVMACNSVGEFVKKVKVDEIYI